jgi:hypothetical protein
MFDANSDKLHPYPAVLVSELTSDQQVYGLRWLLSPAHRPVFRPNAIRIQPHLAGQIVPGEDARLPRTPCSSDHGDLLVRQNYRNVLRNVPCFTSRDVG